jgi:hypothetical protein
MAALVAEFVQRTSDRPSGGCIGAATPTSSVSSRSGASPSMHLRYSEGAKSQFIHGISDESEPVVTQLVTQMWITRSGKLAFGTQPPSVHRPPRAGHDRAASDRRLHRLVTPARHDNRASPPTRWTWCRRKEWRCSAWSMRGRSVVVAFSPPDLRRPRSTSSSRSNARDTVTSTSPQLKT